MRVLHFVDRASALGWFRFLSDHTDPSDVELAFATLGPSGAIQEGLGAEGFETFAMGVTKRREWPRATLQLAAELRRRRFDIVHVHQLEASLVGLIAARLAGVPSRVMTAHHCHEMPLHGGTALRADKLCVRVLADRVIAPCQQLREMLLGRYGADPERVVVIDHGFELERFTIPAAKSSQVREDLGIASTDVLVLAISRLYWIKNLDALIRAFAEVAAEHPDVSLLIVGGGDQASLRELSGNTQVAQRIHFSEFRADVPELLAASDVLIHVSLAESFGQVIIEAMAASRPVITTPVGIAQDVIAEGRTGFVIKGFDERAITAALRRALVARESWPAVGAAAKAVAARFTAERMAHGYVRLYHELHERRGRNRR